MIVTRVHRSAVEGFGRAESVAAYERARPVLPTDAVDYVVATLRLGPDRRVADLGAGTGKLTQLLVPTGAEVIAFEPVDEMRRALSVSLPGVATIAAVAEALPVRAGALDAVVAAQAFHWFDGPRALDAIQRALHPRGRLALAWNVRDDRVAWVRRLTEVMEPHRGDTPGHASLAWRTAFDDVAGFTPLEHAEFAHHHELGVEGVVDRVASVSFIARLPDDERSAVLEEVRFLARAQSQPVTLPYRTHVYWTERQ